MVHAAKGSVMPLFRLPSDPKKSAVAAGLRYVTCNSPGFERRKAGKGFVYLDVDGAPIRDKDMLRRIRSLVLPPAWEKVWICPAANGHLQATGIDARGRRQYRYHPEYRQIRNHTKFHRMLAFAKALPGIRRERPDLKLPGLQRDKVVATVVRLLETTFIRVGNEEYARENSSFGLTTLRDRHVQIEGDSLRFHFRGKSGKVHNVTIEDKRLARIVRDCRDIPGYELFQYHDEFGETHSVDSSDVNGYLREITGEEFSAKDFRTWAGTVLTALALAEKGPAESQSEAKKNIVDAIRRTAARLGNLPATCRNYYVHPAVLDAYLEGSLPRMIRPGGSPDEGENSSPSELHPEEEWVLRIIRKRSGSMVRSIAI